MRPRQGNPPDGHGLPFRGGGSPDSPGPALRFPHIGGKARREGSLRPAPAGGIFIHAMTSRRRPVLETVLVILMLTAPAISALAAGVGCDATSSCHRRTCCCDHARGGKPPSDGRKGCCRMDLAPEPPQQPATMAPAHDIRGPVAAGVAVVFAATLSGAEGSRRTARAHATESPPGGVHLRNSVLRI